MVLAAAISPFLVAAVPVGVLLAIWVAVTGWRIVFPERSLPLVPDRVAERGTAYGESVSVGFREIRDDMRVHTRELTRPDQHTGGSGVPESWIEDLYRRRN